MNYFYAPNLASGETILDAENSRHAIKVMRKRIGDSIHLMDGQGGAYEARIVNDDSKACEVEVLQKEEKSSYRNYHIHILIAPTKNNSRLEWFLEKATEIGIDEITPILCANSERTKLKTDRLEKILIGAMKQSKNFYKPHLNELSSLKEMLEVLPKDVIKIAGYCEGELKHISKVYSKGMDVVVFVGPEGDFSEDEVELMKSYDVKPTSLGDSRLRTETAGLEFCSNIKLLNAI